MVLHAGVPLSAPGVSIIETWDTLGMRGTASHDVVFNQVFVPAEKVVGRRPYGVLAGPLLVAAIHFAPIVSAAYLGVARGACAAAIRLVAARGPVLPAATRQIGEMRARLRVARWALFAAAEEIGADPPADEATLACVMTAKRRVVTEARAVVDTAMEVAGGQASSVAHRWSVPTGMSGVARSTPSPPRPPSLCSASVPCGRPAVGACRARNDQRR